MSNWININLARPAHWRQNRRRRGWALVTLCVLLLLSAVVLRYRSLDHQIATQASLLKTHSLDRRPALTALTPQQVQASQTLQRMLGQLAIPWETLFSSIEASASDLIQLEALQPQPDKSQVVVKVAAKDFSAVMAFVNELRRQPDIAQANLVSETQSDTGAFNWHAMIEIDWKLSPHD